MHQIFPLAFLKTVLTEQQSNHYIEEIIKEITSHPNFKMHGSQLMNSCIMTLQSVRKPKERIERCALIYVTWISKGRRKTGILKSKPRLPCVNYISRNMEVSTLFVINWMIFS